MRERVLRRATKEHRALDYPTAMLGQGPPERPKSQAGKRKRNEVDKDSKQRPVTDGNPKRGRSSDIKPTGGGAAKPEEREIGRNTPE